MSARLHKVFGLSSVDLCYFRKSHEKLDMRSVPF